VSDAPAIQDAYAEWGAHCYGCGRLNEHGLQLKTSWEGDETVSRFHPQPFHTAMPGIVYGGLLASLIDCHGTGTAALAAYRAEGREPGTAPELRYVTASLQVDFVKPTPLGPELEVRGRVEELKGRKVVVTATLAANGEVCVKGRVVAVRVPEGLVPATGSPATPVPARP
jgi:acyl-coenzyme A thioesterase PaaI-like protein